MWKACLLLSLALPFSHAADEWVKPEKITLHTWIREEMFAGWIANDTATFERGVQKLNRYLGDHPDNPNALSWNYLVMSYRMRQAMRKGDVPAYEKQLAAANELRARIFKGEVKDPSPFIIVSASLIATACEAPEKDRAWMFREGRDLLVKVPELQGEIFEKLPPHMRGEYWAQLAFVADRNGNAAERDGALQSMLTKLQGTPYESRAKSWQKPGNIAKEKEYTCMSCHDPGRLAPTMARLNNAPAK